MQTIVTYFHLAGEFTNPYKFITGAILSGLTAFAVALILVLLLRKYILVPRSHKVLKFVAYAYFVALPLLAGFFGLKWGFFHSLRKDIREHTDVYAAHVPPLFGQQALGAVDSLFGGHAEMSSLSTHQLIDTVAVVVYNVYGSTLEQQLSATQGVKGKLASMLLHITKNKSIAAMMHKAVYNLLHDKLGLSEGVSNAVVHTSLRKLVNGNLFVNIAVIQVDQFLKGLQRGILYTFLLILAIPLIEVGYAHYRYRRQPAV
ncbi:hypothetical protein SAMN04488128_104445 [Chitinophaga eiseniae]|uniref:Uncharacterized protein n=1 Tax=Chitinophaga eiseniae TaxID=634771 RepID=A0A1T4TDN2_9BACT|nr:hypothetical protein [Chitinophaga eiseniae]SKA38451.1 hypothetical protein SAMN04488128_104445 [Chitinophaga eiseniae]